MNLSRRTFLKVSGGTLVVAATPWQALGSVPKTTVSVKDARGGKVREIVGYEISRDAYLARWDVFDGSTQVHVMHPIQMGKWRSDESYRKYVRKEAYKLLAKKMRKSGMSWANLKTLPMPEGYVAA